MTGSKAKVFLVHGETENSQKLKDALDQQHDGLIELAVLGREVVV